MKKLCFKWTKNISRPFINSFHVIFSHYQILLVRNQACLPKAYIFDGDVMLRLCKKKLLFQIYILYFTVTWATHDNLVNDPRAPSYIMGGTTTHLMMMKHISVLREIFVKKHTYSFCKYPIWLSCYDHTYFILKHIKEWQLYGGRLYHNLKSKCQNNTYLRYVLIFGKFIFDKMIQFLTYNVWF